MNKTGIGNWRMHLTFAMKIVHNKAKPKRINYDAMRYKYHYYNNSHAYRGVSKHQQL